MQIHLNTRGVVEAISVVEANVCVVMKTAERNHGHLSSSQHLQLGLGHLDLRQFSGQED